MMGRQKEEGKYFPPNNKLVQDPEGNEKKQMPRYRLQQNEGKLCQRTQ
jgi:hypothetical protein